MGSVIHVANRAGPGNFVALLNSPASGENGSTHNRQDHPLLLAAALCLLQQPSQCEEVWHPQLSPVSFLTAMCEFWVREISLPSLS